VDDRVWVPTVFTKNRDRLLEAEGGRATRPRARRSVFPEISKPIRRKLAVSDGMLDVLVAEIVFPSVKVAR
jgi:hypothetical protein